MRVVTAVEKYKKPYHLFLAGGITGCPDWQSDVIEKFKKCKGFRLDAFETVQDRLVLFNPRRPNFDVTDPNGSEYQIFWEYKYLDEADGILFWFPEETLCPTTLFELGKALGANSEVFVGVHPNYKRKQDVYLQLATYENFNCGTEVPVVEDLDALVNVVIKRIIHP